MSVLFRSFRWNFARRSLATSNNSSCRLAVLGAFYFGLVAPVFAENADPGAADFASVSAARGEAQPAPKPESERFAHPDFRDVSRAEIDATFENLRPTPRLLTNDAAMDRARRAVAASPDRRAYFDALKRAADERFNAPPVERKLEGRRLLGVSREALGRIFGWSFLYRFGGDVKYAKRVEKESIAISDFADWNPSHFLDVAEMTTALAIGYDACSDAFSDENRQKIRDAIRDKGVKPALNPKNSWWKNAANWNQVCWCGTLYGALAIADDEPELAREAAWRAANGVSWSMASYEPDGNYTEGPGYWAYGTSFNVMLVAALNSALGNDFGRSDENGFLLSIRYYEHVFGTTGAAFNYPDSGGGRMFEPTAFWFAQKLSDPNVVWNENALLADARLLADEGGKSAVALAAKKRGARSFGSLVRERLAPAALLFAPETSEDREVAATDFDAKNVAENGYVGVGNGLCRVALFRTAWAFDAAYLGIKAGAPKSPHGHMDEGGFVYDDGGVRWISEIGPENYHRIESRGMNLWSVAQKSDRWKLFRYNNFGHSVPTINGKPQLVDGMTTFIETKIGAPGEASFATIDLTPVYRDELKSAVRKATLFADGSLTIEDSFEALPDRAANVERRFITKAKMEISSDSSATATVANPLIDKGLTLKKTVETTASVPTKFRVAPAETDDEIDSKNPGFSALIETSRLEPGQKAVYKTTFSALK